MMLKVIGIRFRGSSRIYFFSPGELNIKNYDNVIVETEKGIQFGKAVTEIMIKEEKDVFLPIKNVMRLATDSDIKTNEKNICDSEKALKYAQNLVLKSNMNMKLFDASYTFDRKKLIFKFIADERVDFRLLAKQLASKYKTRIELRQIGVRDKAKEIGGIGPCGRPLCCTLFLSNFDSVSINMAKNQGIALNPTKINGSCGRLLCCLSYEDFIYTENKNKLPKIGQIIEYNGKNAKVIELDVLNCQYKIKLEESDETFIVGENLDESSK